MKNLIKFFAVLLLVFGYTSCDELDKLTEIDIDSTLTGIIPVDVAGGEMVNLNNSVTINIADGGQDIVDNLNKIEKVKIISLTYTVMNLNGDNTGTITADLKANTVVMDTHTNAVVFDQIGVVHTIDDTTTLNTIANLLKNGSDVVFAITGTSTNEGGMIFDIQVTADIEVTVDAG